MGCREHETDHMCLMFTEDRERGQMDCWLNSGCPALSVFFLFFFPSFLLCPISRPYVGKSGSKCSEVFVGNILLKREKQANKQTKTLSCYDIIFLGLFETWTSAAQCMWTGFFEILILCSISFLLTVSVFNSLWNSHDKHVFTTVFDMQ